MAATSVAHATTSCFIFFSCVRSICCSLFGLSARSRARGPAQSPRPDRIRGTDGRLCTREPQPLLPPDPLFSAVAKINTTTTLRRRRRFLRRDADGVGVPSSSEEDLSGVYVSGATPLKWPLASPSLVGLYSPAGDMAGPCQHAVRWGDPCAAIGAVRLTPTLGAVRRTPTLGEAVPTSSGPCAAGVVGSMDASAGDHLREALEKISRKSVCILLLTDAFRSLLLLLLFTFRRFPPVKSGQFALSVESRC